MNHREIDAKVAECLGWEVVSYGGILTVWIGGDKNFSGVNGGNLPDFSTTGNGMLLLIEEARKQGIWLQHEFIVRNGTVIVCAEAYTLSERFLWSYLDGAENTNLDLPKTYALAFLKAKGIDITPYLEGIA